MNRRTFVRTAAAGLAVVACVARAQPGKTYRIAYLSQGSPSDEPITGNRLSIILKNLGELGYVEGQNLIVEARFAEGRAENLPRLAAEIVKSNPQVIVVPSAGIAAVVLEYTKTIPVVAVSAGALQQLEDVKSLAKPGGNLTGMQLHSPELIGKRLELLQEVVPGLRRVAVLRGVPWPEAGFVYYRDATDAAAARFGIQTRYFQFDRPEELPRVFERMMKERDQALIVWSNPFLNLHRKQIFDLTMRYRMPAIYEVRGYEEELLVYTAKMDDVLREASLYVDKILKGANPGDLPIGQPTRFELIVNLRTARKLGLAIPQSVLARANEVIQ